MIDRSLYEPLTVMGNAWAITSDYTTSADGQVTTNNGAVSVQWMVTNSGLNCAADRQYNVDLRPVAVPQEATYPIRTLDTDFVVSATRAAWVSYTVETSTAATSAGANDDEAFVQLIINGGAVHSAKNRIVATLTAILGLLGITISSNVQRWQLGGFVPAGGTVNITTSGTGTKTLISVQEVLQ